MIKGWKRKLALFLTVVICVTGNGGWKQIALAEEATHTETVEQPDVESVQEEGTEEITGDNSAPKPTEDLTNPSENPTEEPTTPSGNPENPTEDPTNPSENPENPSENPTEDPENPSEDPETPSENPENPTEDPENPDEGENMPATDTEIQEELVEEPELIEGKYTLEELEAALNWEDDFEFFSLDQEELARASSEGYVPELTHTKTITSNGNDDYTLSLDVEGYSNTKVSKPDVLFVVDISGSMIYAADKNTDVPPWTGTTDNKTALDNKTEGGATSRIELARTYLRNLYKSLKESNSVNDIALVTFDNTANYVYEWGKDGAKFQNQIPTYNTLYKDYESHLGTYWNKAFGKAANVMSDRINADTETNRERYVIFLTDGGAAPTHNHIMNYIAEHTGTTYDEGRDQLVNKIRTEAVDYAKKLVAMENVHLICMQPHAQNDNTVVKQLCTEVGGEAFYKLNSAGQYGTVMTEIQQGIERDIRKATDITITDTLSEYVELSKSWSKNYKITYTGADGSTKTVPSSVKATYNSSTKKITLTGIEELGQGEKYTLSFNVKPSQAAYNYRAGVDANGAKTSTSRPVSYPHTGETGTGTSSAGKAGFFSNTSATLSYKFAGRDGSGTYAKPVIQATLLSVPVKKVWDMMWSGVSKPNNYVTVRLYLDDQTTSYYDSRNVYTTSSFTNVPPGHSYRVEEVSSTTLNDYISSVSPAKYTSGQTSAMTSTGFTVTNKYKNVGSLTVRKDVYGENTDKNFNIEITLKTDTGAAYSGTLSYVKNGTTYNASFNNGTATFSLKNGESFTLNKIPVGYQYWVSESASSSQGYNVSYSGSGTSGTFEENSYNKNVFVSNTVSTGDRISVQKVWNWGSSRPESITIELLEEYYGGGISVGSCTLNESNGWNSVIYVDRLVSSTTKCFAKETIDWGDVTPPENWKSEVRASYNNSLIDSAANTIDYQIIRMYGISVTNTEYFSIPVKKVWGENVSDTEKKAIQIELHKDNSRYQTATLSSSNNWQYTFTNQEAGHSYRVLETPIEGFESTVTPPCMGSDGIRDIDVLKEGFTITNRSVINIPVTKYWECESEDDIPESITLRLYQSSGPSAHDTHVYKTVTLTKENAKPGNPKQWYYIFEDVPKGKYYYLEEDDVDGFDSKVTFTDDGRVSEWVSMSNSENVLSRGFSVYNDQLVDLTVSKTVTDDGTIDSSKLYAVDITLSSYGGGSGAQYSHIASYISGGEQKTLRFSGGKATAYLANGESVTIKDIPHGYYATVKEQDVSAENFNVTYFLNGLQNTAITDQKLDQLSNTVRVNNQRKNQGILYIDKEVVGAAVSADEEFPVTVYLSADGSFTDCSYNGTVEINNNSQITSPQFVDGKLSFNVKAGKRVTMRYMPEGLYYKVVETKTDGYTASYTGQTGQIVSGGGSTVIITNTPSIGTLTITKNVTNNSKDSLKEFGINVLLNSAEDGTGTPYTGSLPYRAADGTEKTLYFGTDGKTTVSLKNGESIEISKIPLNYYYTVTENTEFAASYDVQYSINEGEKKEESATGQFTNGASDVSVTVYNTEKQVSLTVSKDVTNYSVHGELYDIEITLTSGANGTGSKYSGTVDYVSNGGSATLNFVDGKATAKLANGNSLTINDIPLGYYVIVQEKGNSDGGYNIWYETNGLTSTTDKAYGQLTKDSNSVIVHNTRNNFLLHVSKNVSGSGYPGERFNINLIVDGFWNDSLQIEHNLANGNTNYETLQFNRDMATFSLSDQESINIYLPYGLSYIIEEVEEEHAGGIKYVASYSDDNGNTQSENWQGKVGTSNSVIITNTVLMDIPVEKNWVDVGVAERPESITLKLWQSKDGVESVYDTVTLNKSENTGDTWTYTFTNVPTGPYYWLEEEDVEGYTSEIVYAYDQSASDRENKKNNQWHLDDGFTVTNTATVSLTVQKKIKGDYIDSTIPFDIEITLNSQANGTGTPYSGTVTYTQGGQTKSLVFQDGTATAQLAAGESVTINNIPSGYYATVKESNTYEGIYCDTYSLNGAEPVYTFTPASLTASSNTIVVTNQREYTNLSVVKEVVDQTGAAIDTSKRFMVDIRISSDQDFTDTSFNGKVSAETLSDGERKTLSLPFTNGVCSFSFRHGQRLDLFDLPCGYYYKVEEQEASRKGYTVKYTDETGILKLDDQKMAHIVNDVNAGTLTLSKKVAGLIDEPGISYVMEICLDETPPENEYIGNSTYRIDRGVEQELLFDEFGCARLSLRDGECATISGLPIGYSYVVREVDTENPDGYSPNLGMFSINYRIDNAETAEPLEYAEVIFSGDDFKKQIEVINTVIEDDVLPELVISKSVKGKITDEEFKIDLYLSEDDLSYDNFDPENFISALNGSVDYEMYDANGVSTGETGTLDIVNGVTTLSLMDGEYIALKNIPRRFFYRVVEQESSSNGYEVAYENEIGGIGSVVENRIMVNVINTAHYELPSSGGIGTYVFTIGGIAIMMTALLLFIKNKRKEDEEEE